MPRRLDRHRRSHSRTRHRHRRTHPTPPQSGPTTQHARRLLTCPCPSGRHGGGVLHEALLDGALQVLLKLSVRVKGQAAQAQAQAPGVGAREGVAQAVGQRRRRQQQQRGGRADVGQAVVAEELLLLVMMSMVQAGAVLVLLVVRARWEVAAAVTAIAPGGTAVLLGAVLPEVVERGRRRQRPRLVAV